MAKKKTTTGRRGRPRIEGDRHTIQARVGTPVYDALVALADANYRSVNAELLVALEHWLRQNGRWPADDDSTSPN